MIHLKGSYSIRLILFTGSKLRIKNIWKHEPYIFDIVAKFYLYEFFLAQNNVMMNNVATFKK